MIPMTPHKVVIGVQPLRAFPVTPLMPHRIPHTPVLPNAPKKALTFQSRIPVAVPCHKATTGVKIIGTALITPVKEEVSAYIPMQLPTTDKIILFSVVSLSLLSRGPLTVSKTSALSTSPLKRQILLTPPLSLLQGTVSFPSLSHLLPLEVSHTVHPQHGL